MKKRTYTLLIWEQKDRRAMLVLIPNSELDNEALTLFRRVHGKCLNADKVSVGDSLAILTVSDALTKRASSVSDANINTPWAMRFTAYIVDDGGSAEEEKPPTPIEDYIITNVYRTGWF